MESGRESCLASGAKKSIERGFAVFKNAKILGFQSAHRISLLIGDGNFKSNQFGLDANHVVGILRPRVRCLSEQKQDAEKNRRQSGKTEKPFTKSFAESRDFSFRIFSNEFGF